MLDAQREAAESIIASQRAEGRRCLPTRYDDGGFFIELEKAGIGPHVAMKRGRAKAKDEEGDARRRAARRAGQVGHDLSQRIRMQVKQVIGWVKTVAAQAKTRFVGRARIEMDAMVAGAAYYPLRLTRLVA